MHAETAPERKPDRHDGSFSLLDALRLVPPAVAERRGLIPLRFEDGRLVAAARAPGDIRCRDALARLGHADARLESIPDTSFRDLMATRYGPSGAALDFVGGLRDVEPGEPTVFDAEDHVDLDASPAPRFLELTLRAAVAEGASDVHIERSGDGPRVRFRVDGVLFDRVAPPDWLFDRVLGRIKSLAGLALGDCLFAQDGQLDFATDDGPISIRVSILPGDRGACAVLRLLAREGEVPGLDALGMDADTRAALEHAVAAPDGLIVLAGPTGSGKTTTLHALLSTLDGARRNIVSIEEPVEIRSRHVRQIPVRRETGLDFAGVLRSVLRQDPDVILVGETRDEETARLVLQASLAGHLVLTTVHASSALQVVDRFDQLGADPAVLVQVLRTAVSQRLLRRLCAACGGRACLRCDGTGFRGRTSVFETLTIDPEVAAVVRRRATPRELEDAARAGGFRSLVERAGDLVADGVTTDDEVRRVLAPARWSGRS